MTTTASLTTLMNRRMLTVVACVGLMLVVSYLAAPARLVDISQSTLSRASESRLQSSLLTEFYQPQSESKSAEPKKASSKIEMELEKPKCKVIKVSMLYGAHRSPQLESALETHRRQSERWGCGFRQLEYDVSKVHMYSKQYWVLSTMIEELAKPEEYRREWIMWVDADSILINPAISPEVWVPPKDPNLDNVYALVTEDQNGLNAGVFYLRIHPSSLDFMARTVAYPSTFPDVDLGWFGEQAAMSRIIDDIEEKAKNSSQPSGIAWVPRMWFNAYQTDGGFQGEPGHMLAHFAGLGETRLSQMQRWLDELKTNQEKWAIEADRLSFKDEITTFWKEYAANMTKLGMTKLGE